MTLTAKGQKSALSPDALFERLNRTELYQLVRRAGIAASPRQSSEQLIALLVGTSEEVPISPYDDMRAAVFAFVDENWLKVKSQLSCPAKAKHPLACYGCVDAKAVHCITSSPSMELYLNRVRDRKKDTPMPAPTPSSPITTYTVKTAPRDAEGLSKLSSFNLKSLFKDIHKELGHEYDGAAYSSFLTLSRPQQLQSVQQLLTELDGGARPKAKTKTKAPPPPPVAVAEDEDEDEEEESDEDDGEEEESDDEESSDEDEDEEEEETPAPPAKSAPKVRLATNVAANTAGAAAAARAAAQARAAVPATAPAAAPAAAVKAPAAVGRPRLAKQAPAAAPAAAEAPADNAEVLAALASLQADMKAIKEGQDKLVEKLDALANLPLGMQSLLALVLSVGEKVHKTDRAGVFGVMSFDGVDDLMTPAPDAQPLEEPTEEEQEEEQEEEEEAPPPPPARGRGKSKGKA